MKERLILAATAVVLCTPAAVFAQQPAAGTAPGATTGPAPATTTAPAAPAAAPPAADQAESSTPELLKPKRFRFSTFSVTNSATSTILGIGRDNIGYEDESYTLDFTLSPQWWFVDEKMHKLFVNASLAISTELTNSGGTTTEREPQFQDVQVGLGYNYSLFTSEDGEWLSRLFVRARGILPTSEISQAQGRYLTTALGTSLLQNIKLLGNSADGLNNLTLIGGVTWSHLFSRATTPTDPDLERPRQTAAGRTFLSDQLTFNAFDRDRIVTGITAILPIYKDLSFNTSWRLISRFRDNFEGNNCEIVVAGQCQQADRLDDGVTYLTNSSVDFGITQGIYDLIYVTVGYNNETLTLGEDGKNRNIFYSPGAIFYADVSVQLDQIYQKASESSSAARNPFVQASTDPQTTVAGSNMPSF